MELKAVHLANKAPSTTYDVQVQDGKISSIQPSISSPPPNKKHAILLPSLCHPHIHLDKPFLLSSDYPQYADLVPTTGTFQEALSNTATAKARYTRSNLELRGSQLIAESVHAGVTAMRAFVEVDHVVGFLCLSVAATLKRRFRKACHVQIVAFAQDPIFSSEYGDQNRGLLEQALERKDEFGIDVLGTTPYVETDTVSANRNVDWAVRKALEYDLHLDFHLDYTLDESTPPIVYRVIDTLQQHKWPTKSSSSSQSHNHRPPSPNPNPKSQIKTIALAHCTRLTLLSTPSLQALADQIHASSLPISFIGLPSSDIYMMGRTPASASTSSSSPLTSDHGPVPRGTLNIPTLLKHPLSLSAALSINNLSNPFTPYGTADPLMLASWGVGIYHAGTGGEAAALYGCVSVGARGCIGLEVAGRGEEEEEEEEAHGERELEVRVGDVVSVEGVEEGEGEGRGSGLVLFQGQEDIDVDGAEGSPDGDGEVKRKVTVPGRGIRTVRDVVWCPPEMSRRKVIIR